MCDLGLALNQVPALRSSGEIFDQIYEGTSKVQKIIIQRAL